MKLKQRNKVEINVVSATSCSKRKVTENSSAHSILRNEFGSRMSIAENSVDASQNAIIFDAEKPRQLDPDNIDPTKFVKDGKTCKKFRSFSISTDDCVKADRRFTTIRQQSDLRQSIVGKKNISASSATVYLKREQF